MKWCEYRLEFHTPPRRPSSPGHAVLGSDTLFAALVHAAALLGRAQELITAAREGQVLLSSVFPAAESGACLLPAVLPDGLVWQETSGPVAALPTASGGARLRPPHRQRRAALKRLTLAASPFAEMVESVRYACFWAGFDPTLEGLLLTCLYLLEDGGVGGGRSVGRGGFLVREVCGIPDPRAEKEQGRLLSLAVPAPGELDTCRRCALWVDRNGFTEEGARGRPNRRRTGLWALAEGTQVPAELRGAITELDSTDPLVHYGLALVARIPEPADAAGGGQVQARTAGTGSLPT